MSDPWLLLDLPLSAETPEAVARPQTPPGVAWPQAAAHERWASVSDGPCRTDPAAGACHGASVATAAAARPWTVTAWQRDLSQPDQGSPWDMLHRISGRPAADWCVGLLLMQPLWRLGEGRPEDEPAPPAGLRTPLRLRWYQPARTAWLALPADGLDAALMAAAAHLCVGVAGAASFMPQGRALWRDWLQGCCRPWAGASLLWDADDILHYLRAEALSPR
ncbi:MAG: hypothetical protein RLY78_3244 [Pseudomonadota bacterium]